MSTQEPSQSQNFPLPFDPFEMWNKATHDGISRMQSFYDELAAMEAKAYERAKTASNQFAELAGESITYFTKLTGEWRQITLEATRRSAEAFKPKA